MASESDYFPKLPPQVLGFEIPTPIWLLSTPKIWFEENGESWNLSFIINAIYDLGDIFK